MDAPHLIVSLFITFCAACFYSFSSLRLITCIKAYICVPLLLIMLFVHGCFYVFSRAIVDDTAYWFWGFFVLVFNGGVLIVVLFCYILHCSCVCVLKFLLLFSCALLSVHKPCGINDWWRLFWLLLVPVRVCTFWCFWLISHKYNWIS